MKKIFFTVFFSFLFINILSAQNVDEILSEYFETIGQKTLLQKGQYVTEGKVVQGQMEIPFHTYHKTPSKFRSEATFQGIKIIQAYDGEKGWSINPMSGSKDPEPMTAEQNDKMEMEADFSGAYYNYKEKGYKVHYLGKEDVDDVETYRIKLTRPNGDEITAFIDAENYVIIKIKFKTKIKGVDREYETYFSNYKVVDGILAPYDIETKFDGKTVNHIVIDKIEYGGDIRDSLFKMPSIASVNDTTKVK